MPLYEFECPNCRAGQAEMRTIAERDDTPPWCHRCQTSMRSIISAVTGFVKNPAAGHKVRRV